MKKENPYSIVKDTEHNPKDWYDTRYGAWEEGYHSRDEIVDGLVEALSLYVVFCGNTAYMAPREGVQKAYTLAKGALDKAKP